MTTKIEYNGSVVATIPNGNTATLSIADKKMKSDIIITVPKAEGGTASAIPTEVSTEAEMTALLTNGKIGGVYKYIGETTDTYENGALYVLEETEAVNTYIQLDGAATGTIDLSQYYGQTWASIGDVDLPSSNGTMFRIFAHQVTYCYITSGNQYIFKDGKQVRPTDIVSGVYSCAIVPGGSND